MKVIDLEQAKSIGGLRLGLVAGLPSPWGEAAKGLLEAAEVEFSAFPYLGSDDSAYRSWTGYDHAPVLKYDDDPCIHTWQDILYLLTSVSANRLVPKTSHARLEVFGLCHEIAGPHGFGWNARAIIVDGGLSDHAHPLPTDGARYFARKYTHVPDARQRLLPQCAQTLAMLTAKLRASANRGSPYLVGDNLSAADIYAATFLVFVAPWSSSECPMPEFLRDSFQWLGEMLSMEVTEQLLSHREYIFKTYLSLPIQLITG